jgi:hypothetical protein
MWALFFFQMFYKRMSTAEALQTHIKPCPILAKKNQYELSDFYLSVLHFLFSTKY